MRTTSYLLALVLVLFASTCYGLRSDEPTHKGNAETAIDRIEPTVVNKNDTSGDNDSKYPTTEPHAFDSKTLDEQKEERGVFDFFKFKNLFRKNLAPTKALSQKILPSDTVMAVVQKNPTTSKLMGILRNSQPKLTEKDVSFFKKNPVFGKLKAIFAKKPAEITKKDIQLMQQTPGLSRAKSLLGTNPSTKSLRQVQTYMRETRGHPAKYAILFVALVIGSILIGGGIILS
ncbi:hypothetical protein KRP22_013502 [Phytophthora ramorum]|uniref:RxLR effector protein n=2 Tax=Phytophthora ramorum TaxID=164328 RepID=H3GF61_PHYRM|nr:hypothetical protein KRP23_1768 [Phytophthora ramorum]KAH7499030.1 hypothetical protein KRP22_11328 [Phytophthora ramorum]